MNKTFFYLSLLSLISGLAISSNVLSFLGVIPNLLLVVTVLSLFFGLDGWSSFLIYLIGFIGSTFEPVISIEIIALTAIIILVILGKRYISFNKIINASLVIILGTVLLYLIINYNFLIESIYILGLELMLNVISLVLGIWLINFLRHNV